MSGRSKVPHDLRTTDSEQHPVTVTRRGNPASVKAAYAAALKEADGNPRRVIPDGDGFIIAPAMGLLGPVR